MRTDWLAVKDDKGRTVARYAYWVEDLQGKIDPRIAGNSNGTGGVQARVAWPFPASGMNDKPLSDKEPTLDQIALFTVDPATTWSQAGPRGQDAHQQPRIHDLAGVGGGGGRHPGPTWPVLPTAICPMPKPG